MDNLVSTYDMIGRKDGTLILYLSVNHLRVGWYEALDESSKNILSNQNYAPIQIV